MSAEPHVYVMLFTLWGSKRMPKADKVIPNWHLPQDCKHYWRRDNRLITTISQTVSDIDHWYHQLTWPVISGRLYHILTSVWSVTQPPHGCVCLMHTHTHTHTDTHSIYVGRSPWWTKSEAKRNVVAWGCKKNVPNGFEYQDILLLTKVYIP